MGSQTTSQNAADQKPPTLERLDDQIEWYDRKSRHNKFGTLTLQIIQIIGATSITLLAATLAREHPVESSILAAFLGAVVILCTAIAALFRVHERWIEFRTTAASLKKEKFLYLTGTEPYNTDDRFFILVQRVETLVSKENTNWAQ